MTIFLPSAPPLVAYIVGAILFSIGLKIVLSTPGWRNRLDELQKKKDSREKSPAWVTVVGTVIGYLLAPALAIWLWNTLAPTLGNAPMEPFGQSYAVLFVYGLAVRVFYALLGKVSEQRHSAELTAGRY